MAEFIEKLDATGVTDPGRIFNADETGLFYRCLPCYVYCSKGRAKTLRGSTYMANKDRVTVMVCMNAEGNKAPLMVIGKRENPRVLERRYTVGDVVYTHQKNAWMDSSVSQYWFDEVFLKYKRKLLGDKEKAVLFWDNAPGHKISTTDDVILLELPPNVTALHQPADAGIIANLKLKYKFMLMSEYSELVPNWEKVRSLKAKQGFNGIHNGRGANLHDACRLLNAAWKEVSSETIINCTIKAQCLPSHVDRALMAKTEKGRAKLASMADLESASMITDNEENWDEWETLDSGDISQLIAGMDSLVQQVVDKNRSSFIGGQGVPHEVFKDILEDMEKLNINSDTCKRNAMVESVTIEDDPEIVQALVDAEEKSVLEDALAASKDFPNEDEDDPNKEVVAVEQAVGTTRANLEVYRLVASVETELYAFARAIGGRAPEVIEDMLSLMHEHISALPRQQATLYKYYKKK